MLIEENEFTTPNPLPDGWRYEMCSWCRGYGMVCIYSASDFEGAGECRECGGSGRFIITPKNRIVDFPGGPFRGVWST